MEGSKGSNNIIVIWMTIVRGDVMRSINPRAKAKNVQNVKLVRSRRRLDLPRVIVETGSEISQFSDETDFLGRQRSVTLLQEFCKEN